MPKNRKNIELEQYLQSLLGSECKSLLNASPEPAAVRVNTLKSSNEQLEKLLDKNHYTFQRIPFNPTGYILKSDPLPLSHSLGFFEGLFQYNLTETSFQLSGVNSGWISAEENFSA